LIYNLSNDKTQSVPYHIHVGRVRDEFLVDNVRRLIHNFDDPLPAAATFDAKQDIEFPDEIEIINSDTTDFIYPSHSTDIVGKAYVYSFEGNSVHSLTSLSSGSSGTTATYTLDISDCFHTEPVFQVYDSLNRMVIPSDIREVTVNETYEFDFPLTLDPEGVQILVIQGYKHHSEEFEPNLVYIPHPVFLRIADTSTLVDDYLLDYKTLSIEHNFNDSHPAMGMLGSDRFLSYPDEAYATDANTVTYTFSKDIPDPDGDVAYVYSYTSNSVHSLTSVSSGSTVDDVTTYTIDISSNNHTNPIFQVFDSTSKLVFPTEIREVTRNSTYEIDFPSTFDPTGVNVLVIQGHTNYAEEFTVTLTNDPVTITHALESDHVFVQVTDLTTKNIIYPADFYVQDEDNLVITTTGMNSSTTYRIHVIKSPPAIVPTVITHNMNSEYLLIQLMDTVTKQVIYPENVRIVDANTIHIYLSGTSVYKVNIATGLLNTPFGISYNNGYYFEFSDENLEDGVIDITHNLDFMHPIVQVYDDINQQIFPKEIKILDVNSIRLIFPEDLEILPNYKVTILSPSIL